MGILDNIINKQENENEFIGYINFTEPLSEDFVGNIHFGKQIAECKIEVFPNEGQYLPHFHFTKISDKRISGCILIYDNKFFLHGNHTAKLNTSQCKDLNAWLSKITDKSPYKEAKLTNWQVICALWDKNNGKYMTNINDQPNYAIMKDNYK